jgi:hypothetical protein
VYGVRSFGVSVNKTHLWFSVFVAALAGLFTLSVASHPVHAYQHRAGLWIGHAAPVVNAASSAPKNQSERQSSSRRAKKCDRAQSKRIVGPLNHISIARYVPEIPGYRRPGAISCIDLRDQLLAASGYSQLFQQT